jgi:putative cofactor-binding repeat protein
MLRLINPMLRLFLITVCFFLFLAPVAGQKFLNIRDFGATGDGKTDDAAAINRALKAAHGQVKNLYFPAGVYLCNNADKDGHILLFEASGMSGVRLYGDSNATRITTSLNSGSTLLYIWAYARNEGLTIKNIFFENTHQLIRSTTQGLFFQGTKGQNFNNLTITGCRFEGFSNAVGGQGVNGWTINKNTFGSPRGHDNAKNDSDPAVYLWFYDNSNGYCSNIRIAGNTADGYTGAGPVSALVTKRALDGFVYGTGYGFTITGNTTRNFSEEHYGLSPKATSPDDASKTLISNNHIDGTIPAGSMDDNGTYKHLSNYGIRCDISDAVITGNVIRNYTYGILIRGVETPKARIHTYQISANKLYAANDTLNYQVQPAILIQGNIGNRVKNIQITGNEIRVNKLKKYSSYESIVLYDMEGGLVQDNTVLDNSHAAAATTQNAAISYRRVGQMQEKSNVVVGMKFRKILTHDDSVQIITDNSGDGVKKNQ